MISLVLLYVSVYTAVALPTKDLLIPSNATDGSTSNNTTMLEEIMKLREKTALIEEKVKSEKSMIESQSNQIKGLTTKVEKQQSTIESKSSEIKGLHDDVDYQKYVIKRLNGDIRAMNKRLESEEEDAKKEKSKIAKEMEDAAKREDQKIREVQEAVKEGEKKIYANIKEAVNQGREKSQAEIKEAVKEEHEQSRAAIKAVADDMAHGRTVAKEERDAVTRKLELIETRMESMQRVSKEERYTIKRKLEALGEKVQSMTLISSTGSRQRPYCSYSHHCTWNVATKKKCADHLCHASGYQEDGIFVSASNDMCKSSAIDGTSVWYYITDENNYMYGQCYNEAAVLAYCQPY